MSDILIRAATPQDLETILCHRRAMFEEMGSGDAHSLDVTIEESRSYLAAALGDGSYRGWLAQTAEGRVVAGAGVGLIGWPPRPSDPQPRRPTIFNVYTEPEFRRRGLARRLMRVMIAWCRQEGFRVVYLHASEEGRPLYASLGFAPTNEMRLHLK